MPAGRPQIADPGSLYMYAQQFYLDLRRLAEGSFRRQLDKSKFQTLMNDSEKRDEYIRITDEDRQHHNEAVDEEVRNGRLKPSQRETRLQDIESGVSLVRGAEYERWAAEQSIKQVRIPGESDVIDALLRAETPEQVKEVCREAIAEFTREVSPGVHKDVQIQSWPIAGGSMLPAYLSQYASEFIAAKADGRFPHSQRPSTCRKQLWFLARALAGAVFGIQPRTAINLVGSTRPEEMLEYSRGAKSRRKRSKVKFNN